MDGTTCLFCKIAAGNMQADMVYTDNESVAFLDNRPLFPGHVLLCPREHYKTVTDLPLELTGPMMVTTQLLAKAVQAAVNSQGTFIAINNHVSQTVPHLHIHIVPRNPHDGLKGFFWPRHRYKDDAAREAVRHAIEQEIKNLRA